MIWWDDDPKNPLWIANVLESKKQFLNKVCIIDEYLMRILLYSTVLYSTVLYSSLELVLCSRLPCSHLSSPTVTQFYHVASCVFHRFPRSPVGLATDLNNLFQYELFLYFLSPPSVICRSKVDSSNSFRVASWAEEKLIRIRDLISVKPPGHLPNESVGV